MPPVLWMLKTTGDVEKLREAYDRSNRANAGEAGRGKEWGIPLVALRHTCAFSDEAMYLFDVFKDEETLRTLVFNREALPEHLRPRSGAMSSTVAHRELSNNESLQDRFERDSVILKLHVALPAIESFETRPAGLSLFE